MQSFYIPNALDCIISIIENYESLLLNIHNEVNETQDDVFNFISPSGSPDNRRSNSPARLIRGSSPSKIFRDSKIRINELKVFKVENETDFIDENEKKNQTYVELYDSLVSGWQEQEEIMNKTQWDLLNFFIMMIFLADLTLNDKKNLLKFLKTSVVLNGNGVNVNQELIFKYLNLSSKKINILLFKKMLFSIQTSQSTIMITNEGVSYKLEDAFIENSMKSLGDISKKLQLIPRTSNSMSPNQLKGMKNKKNVNIYNHSKYLCDQFDFYAMMCNGRNHTWKKFLEDKIGFEAMIQYLDADLEFGIFIIKFL